MKTAREIIASQVCAELNDVAFADLPEIATYLERKTHIDRPLIDQNEALVSADAILAALAAEGFSIVETGHVDELADAAVELRGRFRSNTEDDWAASSRVHDAIMAVRARSTREGKTG